MEANLISNISSKRVIDVTTDELIVSGALK